MLFGHIYAILFIVTAAALYFMAIRSYKNIDPFYWTLVILFPIVNLCYCLRTFSDNFTAAIIANDILNIDGTVIPLIFLFSMCRSFKINIKKSFRIVGYIIAFILLLVLARSSLTNSGFYYKTVEFVQGKYGSYLSFTDGIGFYIQTAYLAVICFSILGVFIYIFQHRERCSIYIIWAYGIIGILGIVIYVFEFITRINYELFPFLYAFASWTIALSYELSFRHDIDSIVLSINNGQTNRGYLAFDIQRRFLGANDKAKEFLPMLADLPLDRPIGKRIQAQRIIFYQMMSALEEGASNIRYEESRDKRILKYEINYFYSRRNSATIGYIFELSDDTENQRNVELIRNYNLALEKDVKHQTEHIREIQEKVVLGLAEMIENRDDSTGGHVKRTSEVVKILVDTMVENNIGNIDRTLADQLVRAASMHDLGKIAIDNSILCKPGRLTDEEYNQMKIHAVKSSEIVNSILRGVEEPGFVQVAYNIARFHHEKWDGSGYPEARKENAIPIEARIMAVADVYDALVSKRCYKEPMSFEKAYKVMKENMGTHFDPMMDEVFELCHEQMEEYYSENK